MGCLLNKISENAAATLTVKVHKRENFSAPILNSLLFMVSYWGSVILTFFIEIQYA